MTGAHARARQRLKRTKQRKPVSLAVMTRAQKRLNVIIYYARSCELCSVRFSEDLIEIEETGG